MWHLIFSAQLLEIFSYTLLTCWFSVWTVLHVTILVSRILKVAPRYFENLYKSDTWYCTYVCVIFFRTPSAGYIMLVLRLPPFSKTGVAINSYQESSCGQIVLLSTLVRFSKWKIKSQMQYIYILHTPTYDYTHNRELYVIQLADLYSGPGNFT
jgi:hypothetical protein